MSMWNHETSQVEWKDGQVDDIGSPMAPKIKALQTFILATAALQKESVQQVPRICGQKESLRENGKIV